MLREGALHLTGLAMLAPHLTTENQADLLARARHLSKRRIEELLADWRPKADKPDRVRPVAPPKAKIEPIGPAQKPAFMTLAPTLQPAQPIERRHAITFTATERVKQKLDRARALASHRLRSQHVEDVLELALDTLIAKLEKEREGAATHPRPQPPQAPHSRVVPRAVRREVYQRAGHQCTFTAHGRRCSERSFLELHHIDPFALGGPTTAQNLTLLCRAHHAHEGDLLFAPSQ